MIHFDQTLEVYLCIMASCSTTSSTINSGGLGALGADQESVYLNCPLFAHVPGQISKASFFFLVTSSAGLVSSSRKFHLGRLEKEQGGSSAFFHDQNLLV